MTSSASSEMEYATRWNCAKWFEHQLTSVLWRRIDWMNSTTRLPLPARSSSSMMWRVSFAFIDRKGGWFM